MAIRQRKDGRWVVYYRSGGKITEEYFGRGPEAEAAAVKRNDSLNLRPYTKGPASSKGPLFEDLAQQYVKNKDFDPYPRKHLLIRLAANILPFLGDRIAVNITHHDMNRYVEKRRADGVKGSTIRREITDIKAILNWATRWHPPLIPLNPIREFQAPKPDDDIIYPPTAKELKKIMAEAPDHLKRAISLSFYTGLRPGAVELLSITWSQVNFEYRIIHIISAKKGGPKRREVPIHRQFLPTLSSWFDSDKEFFSRKSKNITIHNVPIIHFRMQPIKSIRKTWKTTLERAGIKRRIRPYDLRHQFITRALENGADLKTVSEIVGSDPKTLLKHYQHVSNKMRRKLIDDMEEL